MRSQIQIACCWLAGRLAVIRKCDGPGMEDYCPKNCVLGYDGIWLWGSASKLPCGMQAPQAQMRRRRRAAGGWRGGGGDGLQAELEAGPGACTLGGYDIHRVSLFSSLRTQFR
jgi:hypothetical protein